MYSIHNPTNNHSVVNRFKEFIKRFLFWHFLIQVSNPLLFFFYVLGYDRSIPGYQRYRIIGDVGRGEHTLQITDVQLDDAGEYECQVTPVPANNHPLLRRKTELIVLSECRLSVSYCNIQKL